MALKSENTSEGLPELTHSHRKLQDSSRETESHMANLKQHGGYGTSCFMRPAESFKVAVAVAACGWRLPWHVSACIYPNHEHLPAGLQRCTRSAENYDCYRFQPVAGVVSCSR